MPKNADSITLGLGDLSVNGVDAGYLGGKVVFEAGIEFHDWDAGVPLVIVDRSVTGIKTALKASLAQLDLEALQLSLGVGSVSGSRLNLGGSGSCSLPTLSNVQFAHERPDGKTVTIFFPKAKIEPGSLSLNFSAADFVYQDIVITPIYDRASAGYPLGYIDIS